MREIEFICGFTQNPEGSVLARFGRTVVLCTVKAEEGVPNFIEGEEGWLTAEYSMLPGSTYVRKKRRTAAGELDGRTVEISRLIGRSIRSCIDLSKLGRQTLYVDCDVLQADGGTRTAAISGAALALRLAVDRLLDNGFLEDDPFTGLVGAVSVGKVDGRIVCDLSYDQDVRATVDFNVIMTQEGEFVEVQGTGEGGTFSEEELIRMLASARKGIEEILLKQEESLEAYRRSYTQSW